MNLGVLKKVDKLFKRPMDALIISKSSVSESIDDELM
jgi:hypothetical protein